MQLYEAPSRFLIMSGREGEILFASATIRILCDARRTPKEYLVGVGNEVLLDTSGTPAVFLDWSEALAWGKEHARCLSLGRRPPVPSAPEQFQPQERPRRPGRSGRSRLRRRR